MLRPANDYDERERILVFGNGGTGKTNAIFELARKNPEDQFYVINNDYRAKVLLTRGFPDVAERGNVHITGLDSTEWLPFWAEIKRHRELVKENDWLVIDLLGPTWTAVQYWFIEDKYGIDAEDYMQLITKQQHEKGKRTGGLIDPAEWGIINTRYNRLWGALRSMKCHVYATAEVKAVSEDSDPKIKSAFGAYGVSPKGNSALYHHFDEVLLFKKSKIGDYKMTSCKVTGREEFEDEAIGNWSTNYLRKYAGWKEVSAEPELPLGDK